MLHSPIKSYIYRLSTYNCPVFTNKYFQGEGTVKFGMIVLPTFANQSLAYRSYLNHLPSGPISSRFQGVIK